MNDLDRYLRQADQSRTGVMPIHFRISNIRENPRLPPGVRADDMPTTPVVTPLVKENMIYLQT